TRKLESGNLPKNGAVVKTIVTTELARKLASSFNVTTFDVLTGFKFIGEKIKEWEKSGEYTYLFGFEESYGSLVGTHARDKDAVVASMMFAEMICYFESKHLSVYNVLQDIYKKFGYFLEKAISVTFGGIDGMEKMANIMLSLRKMSFTSICGVKVLAISDFVERTKHIVGGKTEAIDLPKTNALKLHLENGDWICVRPSGTEPKLKIYAATSQHSAQDASAVAEKYLDYMKT
ncbi:MAG: phospho-sugar mutase, partial [Clostridia bacterium]